MTRLDGRTALVTGGASGIGAATVRRLAVEGARVFVADVDAGGARAVAREVGGDAIAMDVSDVASVRAGVEEALDSAAALDVLVNNAGIGRVAPFLETDEELWDLELGVNLRGTVAVTHAVLPSMHRNGGGAIVNVASEAGRMGTPGGAVYSAAKAGVIGFTKAIARESARFGVRCNAVAPGPIETPLLNDPPAPHRELAARMKRAMIAATVTGRSGSPDEVAAAIAYLASADASYVTGQTLGVSGGASMS
jgi:2-hydroxycyclohexanecarboxyl-CoA dehydrogenase